MRLLLTGCRLPQTANLCPQYVRKILSIQISAFLRIAMPRLCSKTPQSACAANAAGIGVLRLIDFILPGVQDTSERDR